MRLFPWMFEEGRIPTGFWENQTHAVKFFDWLFGKLGYERMGDWYKVTVEDISSNGGGALLGNKYNNSPSKALQSVYPQHKWELERFKQKPNGYWSSQQHQIEYFDWLFTKLGHKRMEDWYNVTVDDIQSNEGASLLHKYNGSPPKHCRVFIRNTNGSWKSSTTNQKS